MGALDDARDRARLLGSAPVVDHTLIAPMTLVSVATDALSAVDLMGLEPDVSRHGVDELGRRYSPCSGEDLPDDRRGVFEGYGCRMEQVGKGQGDEPFA